MEDQMAATQAKYKEDRQPVRPKPHVVKKKDIGMPVVPPPHYPHDIACFTCRRIF